MCNFYRGDGHSIIVDTGYGVGVNENACLLSVF